MSRSELDWLPPGGAHLDRSELKLVLEALRSIVDGTVSDEPNRAHAVSIATIIGSAISREEGER